MNEKNTNITEIVFILDRSGSMGGLESDTIGGFNAMLRKQRNEPGTALVSTVLFDHESVVIHDRVPIDRVKDLTENEYSVRGSTALLDAIGGAVHHIGTIHKYARPEDVPARTVFIITTDGMENASRRFSAAEVRAMVTRQQERFGWEFLFLGANIDAIETAGRFGIPEAHAVEYLSDHEGTLLNYEAVSAAISSVRSRRPLGAEWKAGIDQDYTARAKKRRK